LCHDAVPRDAALFFGRFRLDRFTEGFGHAKPEKHFRLIGLPPQCSFSAPRPADPFVFTSHAETFPFPSALVGPRHLPLDF
jgi:hypothetical protein